MSLSYSSLLGALKRRYTKPTRFRNPKSGDSCTFNLFCQLIIQEGTLHIHLINFKDRMFSECQKNPDSLKYCYWCICFILDYFCLRVTFSNQYDIVPRNKVIFIQLLSEYPSNANNSFILCPGYQLQCYLPFNSNEFILLCNYPIRIHQSFFNLLRFFRQIEIQKSNIHSQ